MQNERLTTATTRKEKKKKGEKPFDRTDPFAVPPNPLGYNALTEERPLRASRFSAVLPSVVAKYGLTRKLGAERLAQAWREALTTVFGAEIDATFQDESYPNKLETYLRYARPVSIRGGALRVELASNLLFQELQFYVDPLLSELKTRLQDEKIDKIKLSVRR